MKTRLAILLIGLVIGISLPFIASSKEIDWKVAPFSQPNSYKARKINAAGSSFIIFGYEANGNPQAKSWILQVHKKALTKEMFFGHMQIDAYTKYEVSFEMLAETGDIQAYEIKPTDGVDNAFYKEMYLGSNIKFYSNEQNLNETFNLSGMNSVIHKFLLLNKVNQARSNSSKQSIFITVLCYSGALLLSDAADLRKNGYSKEDAVKIMLKISAKNDRYALHAMEGEETKTGGSLLNEEVNNAYNLPKETINSRASESLQWVSFKQCMRAL